MLESDWSTQRANYATLCSTTASEQTTPAMDRHDSSRGAVRRAAELTLASGTARHVNIFLLIRRFN